jgi:hypothetical protein
MAARPSRLARALVLLLVLAAAAACGRQPPPARVARAYDLPPAPCLAELARQGARFETVGHSGEGGCRVEAPVRVHATTAAMARPLLTSCSMALALLDWERRSLQPRALALLGQPVARLHHFGSHACRGMRGRGGRPSVHAVARAVDLHAFELADGRMVRVDRHWRPRGPKRRFLRAVALDACALFSVTLTPASDRDHADHFHLDIGPRAHCGA